MSKNVLTREIAKTVFILLKKTGGLSLKQLHECIKQVNPRRSPDIVRLNTILQKAAAIGAVQKRNNRYTLGSLIKHKSRLNRRKLPVKRICNNKRRGRSRRRKPRRGRKSRSRRRRR